MRNRAVRLVRTRGSLRLEWAVALWCAALLPEPCGAQQRPSFWHPQREAAAALQELKARNDSPQWRAWWDHLQGDRLLAIAGGQAPVDRALLVAVCRQLDHPAARSEPAFSDLHAALLDWRVELALPQEGALPGLIRRAAERFRPATPPEVEGLVRGVRLAAARTAASLQGPYAQGWRRYLRLEALSRLPALPPPAAIEPLEGLYGRMSRSHEGLDRRTIVELRGAVGRLIDGLESLHGPEAQAEHRRRMLELADALEALPDAQDPAALQAISSTLAWLERSDRRRPFAYAVRRQYFWPNVYVDVSAPFLRRTSLAPYVRTDSVRDQIQEIAIHGARRATGLVWLEIVPNPTRICFDVMMQGESVARTVGDVRRAHIHSLTTAAFTARKRIEFDGRRLTHWPASAAAWQWSRIRCVAVDVIRLLRRFATRLAWRQALARKPEVDRISRQRTEDQVREQFDRELAQELARLSQFYRQAVWAPLERYDEFPRLTQLRTTPRAVEVRALLTDVDTAGAPQAPPPPDPDAAVTIRVHESALAYAARRLSDRRWTERELDETLHELFELGAALPSPTGGAIFDFARDQALSVEFAGNQVQLTLRLDEVSLDGRSFRDLRVDAVYDVRNLADQAQLVRRGPVQLDPIRVRLNGEPLPEMEDAVRQLLRREFERELPPVLQPRLPAWWRQGRVTLRRIGIERGWLVLTWDAGPRASDRTSALKSSRATTEH